MLTRREWLMLGAGAYAVAATRALGLEAAAPLFRAAARPFSLPDLPYSPDALEPHIDAETMRIHHGRHHAAYVDELNDALENRPDLAKLPIEELLRKLDALPREIRTTVRNNGGGHYNHALFWPSLRTGGGGEPDGDLGKAIADSFGSYRKLRDALTGEAMDVFGSGWGWLSLDTGGKLIVERTSNQDSPLMHGHEPLLGIDVWEHAYYLRYQDRRREYVDALFNVIDWQAIQERYLKARR
jgi:superoxide dismutase, Fe-Mn family